MIPHIFCSKDCFQANWKIHKKEHQEFSSIVSTRLKLPQEDEEEAKLYKAYRSLKRSRMETCDANVIYARMMTTVSAAIVKMNLNKAETLCRKIIKLYPLASEPYTELGLMRYSYCKSSHLRRKEAAQLFEISIVKTAHFLLNGSMDGNFNYTDQIYEFLKVLNYIFEMQNDLNRSEEVDVPIFKADWIVNEKRYASLHRFHLQFILDKDRSIPFFTYGAKRHFSMIDDFSLIDPNYVGVLDLLWKQEILKILVRLGLIHQGLTLQGVPVLHHHGQTFSHMATEDLLAAETAFKDAFKVASDIKSLLEYCVRACGKFPVDSVKNLLKYGIMSKFSVHYIEELILDPSIVQSAYIAPLASLLETRQEKSEDDENLTQTRSPFFNGEWVIAHGLTRLSAAIGKTLNNTAALVKSDTLNEEGRVAVFFEEGGPIKYLKPTNLKKVVEVHEKYSFLVCLPESDQWKFMMKEGLAV
ncbi:predicted protein [Chaetoceros tenuissimus]|uniref:Uncharacterized protein n=1 Tax=Chaetoceros tenuissimus TaxID=426638 RepID=A0AAD3H2D1_9STRA|nr:predicted protein [Chaetoceros tenuissimus]